MQASDQSAERLHQQASAQYLQGKFDAALATWKQILAGDAEDERANEGVRLCELLTEDGAIEAGAVVNEEAEEPIEFQVPSMEIDLPPKAAVDPLRQAEGIDLGAAPEALELDGEIQEPDVQEVEAELDPIVEGLFDHDPAPDVEDASTPESREQVQSLIHEALTAYGSGDIVTARGVLTCIFILDKNNSDALQLQEQIENEVPPATEQADVADLDAPDHDAAPGTFDLAADAPADPAVTEAPETEPEVDNELVSEILDAPAADSFPEFEGDSEFADDTEFEEPDETSEPSKIKLPQFDLAGLKTRWIVIGVVVGAFVVVGVGFYLKLRAIEPREVSAPIAVPAEVAPAPEAQTPQVEPQPTPQPNVAPTEDLATLLERGNKAFAAQEYSAAIVAFDAVLKQQPSHLEANERMESATELYRQQQETQQQWLAAASLFRDGEYRSAMQMFYRLPQDSQEDRVRLNGYKENGWYNMGLLALRSGQCARAREHFDEAASVDPEDADIAMALALCDTCEGGSRRNGFQRAVAAMSIRGLDD